MKKNISFIIIITELYKRYRVATALRIARNISLSKYAPCLELDQISAENSHKLYCLSWTFSAEICSNTQHGVCLEEYILIIWNVVATDVETLPPPHENSPHEHSPFLGRNTTHPPSLRILSFGNIIKF